ncbi:MAG: PAS domain-containing protein [Gammaproteobacteria bacterium]
MAVERLFQSFAAHHDPADLLDALATGVVMLDAALVVMHANVAAQGLMAVGLNQARGRPFCELFTDCTALQVSLLRVRDTGEPITEIEQALRPLGAPREARIVDFTITAIDDVGGSRRLLLELADAAPRARQSRSCLASQARRQPHDDSAAGARDQKSARRRARRRAVARTSIA